MTVRVTPGPDTTIGVLYATDGGSSALAAGDLLMRFARRDVVEVTVASAADLQNVVRGAAEPGPATSVAAGRRRGRELALATCHDLQATGLRASTLEVESVARTDIMELAHDGDHDVILMGSDGKKWLDRLPHGSFSTHPHSAPVPVLLVHRVTSHPKLGVLVADDGSQSARRAQSLLMRMADPAMCVISVLGIVTPVALAAVPEPTAFSTRRGIPTDPVEVAELEHERIAAARERVAEVARSFQSMGFAATSDTDIGHPAPAIRAVAEMGDYDLVVMGSRGLGAVRAKLLRSVGEEASRYAAATLVAR
jgi:nucleotide-binding universal stress UspA family protein